MEQVVLINKCIIQVYDVSTFLGQLDKPFQ